MSDDGLGSGGLIRLTLKDDLPFVQITVTYQGAELEISDVLVDTGSATTILAADHVIGIGIVPEPSDILHGIRTVILCSRLRR